MKRLPVFFVILLTLGTLSTFRAFGQMTPSDDAYTLTSASTKNFGTAKTLEVESAGATSFIRFDLSPIPPSVTGSMVAKGTLKLFVKTVPTAGSFNIDLVTSSWNEGAITANNAPTLGADIASAVPISASDKDQYLLIDVTAAVVDWLNGTANDGLALVPDGSVSFTLDSKEATTTSHPAELDIVLTGPAGPQGPPGPISGVTAGPGLTGGGTKGNVTVSMLTNCASGQILQWTGSTWACSNAGTGTVTAVTAGTDLTGGGNGGNVTLNLNTAATDVRYAQLGASNSFNGNETVTGSVTATGTVSAGLGSFSSNSSNSIVNVTQNATSGPGFAVAGTSYNANHGMAAVIGQELSKSNSGVFGVEGFIFGPTGSGTYGQNNSPQSTVGSKSAVAAGVWGDAGSGGTAAVVGTADGVNGIVGFNNSPSWASIVGENQNTSTGALAPAVVGISFSPQGMSVVGTAPVHSSAFNSTAGIGFFGVAGDAGTGNATGVLGTADSGTAVLGIASSSGSGVYGRSGSGIAVEGYSSSGTGVYGGSSSSDYLQPGVWGDGTGGDNSGVMGTSSGGLGVYGVGYLAGVAGSATDSGLYGGEFDSGSAPDTYSLWAQGNGASQCWVDNRGNLGCTGSKSAVVQLPDSRWVRLYAIESPENWFEDFGSAQLTNGTALVTLEPTFAATVSTGNDYRVFPVPDGECNGLYVTQKTANSFVIRELGGGKSNVAFDYRIVARRKGYETVRMEDISERLNRARSTAEKIRSMKTPQHPALLKHVVGSQAAPLSLPIAPQPVSINKHDVPIANATPLGASRRTRIH